MLIKQCRNLAKRFRKVIRGELISKYDVDLRKNETNSTEETSSISYISYKIAEFDGSVTANRKSIRRNINNNQSKGTISPESDSNIDGGRLRHRNVGNGKSLSRKYKPFKTSSKIRKIVPKTLRRKPFRPKRHYSPPSSPSSFISFEDSIKPQTNKENFSQTEICDTPTQKRVKGWLIPSKGKRAFLRPFRRCSVRYSCGRRKRKLKASKSETFLSSTFNLSPLRKSYSNNDVIDGFSDEDKGGPGRFFGRFLEDICDQNELPPKSIFILLGDLSRRGPSEVGVFRKSGNARIVRELKVSIENDDFISCNNMPVSIVASLFKEFLRSLPNCLFCCELYEQWLGVSSLSSKEEKVHTIQHLCSCIPGSHRILVKLVLYVLNLISANSEFNMMTPVNLGICVGPSILNSCKKDFDYTPKVSEVVSFMITNFEEVFGKNDGIYLEKLLRQSLQEIDADGYKEQFLSQVTKISEVSSSLDSGISSEAEDNHCSDVTNYVDVRNFISSTPVSCVSLKSNVSKDEVDNGNISTNEDRGTVSTDKEDKGTVSTDEEYKKTVSTDEEDKRTVSTDEEDKRTVFTDGEDKRTVSTDGEDKRTVSTDGEDKRTVSTDEEGKGNVSTDEEDKGNVSTDEEDKGNISTDEVKRPINQNFKRNCKTRMVFRSKVKIMKENRI